MHLVRLQVYTSLKRPMSCNKDMGLHVIPPCYNVLWACIFRWTQHTSFPITLEMRRLLLSLPMEKISLCNSEVMFTTCSTNIRIAPSRTLWNVPTRATVFVIVFISYDYSPWPFPLSRTLSIKIHGKLPFRTFDAQDSKIELVIHNCDGVFKHYILIKFW